MNQPPNYHANSQFLIYLNNNASTSSAVYKNQVPHATTRQSKRQAGGSPGGDSLPKQARKPNTNTLEHFSLGQGPLRVDKRKKRKQLDEDEVIPMP
jgi:hypothetical protein